MAPNEMHDRIDEHDKRLDYHDERLNIHAARFDRISLIIEGDDKGGIKGLVGMMRDMSEAVSNLVEWRKEWEITFRVVRVSVVVGLFLLGIIGAGVWWPQIELLLKVFGGLP